MVVSVVSVCKIAEITDSKCTQDLVVSWCFEPSQPQRNTSGLNAHKSCRLFVKKEESKKEKKKKKKKVSYDEGEKDGFKVFKRIELFHKPERNGFNEQA